MAAIITLDDVSVTFHEAGHTIEAVKHASLEVEQGEIFGIVGFSGAGKSTRVRTIMKVDDQSDKRIVALDGINKLENFFLSLGISTHLKDYQINKEDIDLMCERIPLPVKGKISLTRDLVKRIYLLAL